MPGACLMGPHLHAGLDALVLPRASLALRSPSIEDGKISDGGVGGCDVGGDALCLLLVIRNMKLVGVCVVVNSCDSTA